MYAKCTKSTTTPTKIAKFVSILCTSTCFLLCAWQVGMNLQKFIDQPIGTNVRIQTMTSYKTPKITLCHASYEIGYNVSEIFLPICGKHENCKNLSYDDKRRYPFDKMNTSLSDLWNMETNEQFLCEKRCHFAANPKFCESPKWLENQFVDTIAGKCQNFHSDVEWHFSGKSWVWWIQINHDLSNSSLPINFPDYFIELHTSNIVNHMFTGQTLIHLYMINDLEISMTEFNYLQTRRNPCTTQDEAIQCLNDWINKSLHAQDIDCRWPFTDSKLPYCNSLEETEKLRNKIINLHFAEKPSECNRVCSLVKYSIVQDSREKKINATVIGIAIRKNYKEVIEEFFSYPYNSLVSDLGGSIGLFLGISLLSCLKYALNLCKPLARIN